MLSARQTDNDGQWVSMLRESVENLKSTGPRGPWGFESLAQRHS
jgi:hypothetical protein